MYVFLVAQHVLKMFVSVYIYYIRTGLIIQLDWTCCADTQKTIFRETERTTADLNIRMKSSRRSVSIGVVQKKIFSFFRELFLKNRQKMLYFLHGTVECASSKALIRRSQVLLKCLSLTVN